MKPEKLEQALDAASDAHIQEAAEFQKRRPARWPGALAAMLSLVLLTGLLTPFLSNGGKNAPESAPSLSDSVTNLLSDTNTHTNNPFLLVGASAARVEEFPDYESLSTDDFNAALDRFWAARDSRATAASAALTQMESFLTDSCTQILSGSENSNRVWSPVNGYLALAMLAESTGGSTRQQVLDLLGVKDLDTLRNQVSAVWEQTYCKQDQEICLLSNSLWLHNDIKYHSQALENLSYYHYADSFQGNLGTAQADKAIAKWIDDHTGSFLQEDSSKIDLSDLTVMVLASTVYLQTKWGYETEFNPDNNTEGVFHAPSGDVDCTFMHHVEYQTNYYWGDSYGAISLPLRTGSNMWLILPDADKNVDTVLAEGQYLKTVTAPYKEDDPFRKYCKVNLDLPKFDVSYAADLKENFQQLGLTEVFLPDRADFSPVIADSAFPVWLDSIQQAARVTVDEEGITAASYIILPEASAAMPPDEIVTFTLDRPFLFVITKNQLPIFTGVVNTP